MNTPLAAYRALKQGTQPEYYYPPYGSTTFRAPSQRLITMPQTISEVTGPVFGFDTVKAHEADLTKQHKAEPLGERMILSGRVLDENGRPMPHTLVEIWQPNSAGRYAHKRDTHGAPLDPNFTGCGRALTDAQGRYQFVTIKPGAYPWPNHYNAWRPAHIHFSLFGQAFMQRLVTQMYFPGDPLLPFDPIFNSTANEQARNRLISSFDWEHAVPDHALAFKFDVILRGRNATPASH